MDKVRFGVIGCGGIAGKHIKSIKDCKNAVLIAVADIVEEKAKKMGEQYKSAWYKDYKEMLKRKDIDAVTITTPSGLHMQNAIDSMQAGKHVLTEKPIEVTLEKIDKMIEVAKETGKKIACVFQSRFCVGENKVKEAIDKGKFGKLVLGDMYNKWYRSEEYYKRGEWRATWELDGGGALMNQAIHGIDMLLYLMGEVASVTAYTDTLARKMKVEDTAVAILRFKSGALGVIEGTTSVYPGFTRKLEIHGDKGSVILEAHTITKWHFIGEEDLSAKNEGKDGIGAATPEIEHEEHKRQIEAFTQSLIEGKQPEVNPIDARKSVEIVLAIYKSSKERREIKLPL